MNNHKENFNGNIILNCEKYKCQQISLITDLHSQDNFLNLINNL